MSGTASSLADRRYKPGLLPAREQRASATAFAEGVRCAALASRAHRSTTRGSPNRPWPDAQICDMLARRDYLANLGHECKHDETVHET